MGQKKLRVKLGLKLNLGFLGYEAHLNEFLGAGINPQLWSHESKVQKCSYH